MAKNKVYEFLQNCKINKALASNEVELKKGDEIVMFNNKYKVANSTYNGYVNLQDTKGLMVALPSNKLRFLIKNNLAKKAYKSIGFNNNPEQIIKKNIPEKASVVPNKKEMPVGTVRNGLMKVSSKPSKWVHIQSGHSFDKHQEADPHGSLHHEDDLVQAHNFHRSIVSKAHPEDHENLKEMINDWHGDRRKWLNMIEVRKGISKQGQALPSWFNENAQKLHDTSMKTWNKFTNAFKMSIKKKLTEK